MLKPNELLKRRWQLINPYPGSAYYFSLNSILTEDDDGSAYGPNPNSRLSVEIIEMCTANFRELQWWENRSKEDMPEYLKSIPTGIVYKFKCVSNDDRAIVYVFDSDRPRALSYLLPATFEEYTDYIAKSTTE